MLISVGGLSVIILWKTCQILHACIGSPPPVALAEPGSRCRAGATLLPELSHWTRQQMGDLSFWGQSDGKDRSMAAVYLDLSLS